MGEGIHTGSGCRNRRPRGYDGRHPAADSEAICGVTRSTLLHYGYPGRIATAGNLAFPFSPSDAKMGAAYEFSVYHLMPVEDQRIFRREIRAIGGRRGGRP